MRLSACVGALTLLAACVSVEGGSSSRRVSDDITRSISLMISERQSLLSHCMRLEGHTYTAVEPPKGIGQSFVEPVSSPANLAELETLGYGATSSIEFAIHNDSSDANRSQVASLSVAEQTAYGTAQSKCIANLPKGGGATGEANRFRTDVERLRNRWLNDVSLGQAWKSWSGCMKAHSLIVARRDDTLVQVVLTKAGIDLRGAGLSEESHTQQHLSITHQAELRIAKVDADCLRPIMAIVGPRWLQLARSLRRP